MSKKSIFINLLCIIFGLFLASSGFADAADDDRGLEDNMTFHVYDDVDLVSTLKFEYGKPRIIIKSVYPQLASETDHEGVSNFNEIALEIVKDEISRFRQQVKDLAAVQSKMPKKSVTNNLYIDYNTSFIKPKRDHILSIRFSIQGTISGMAHPYHNHLSLNYNLDKNRRIELEELFSPNSNYLYALSDASQRILQEHLSNHSLIRSGVYPTVGNFRTWNLKSNGILFTFDEGQVAPRVFGTQSALIPYSALSRVISPNAPIAECLKNKSKCSRNNLLTGGFIDEAVNTRHSGFNPILSKL